MALPRIYAGNRKRLLWRLTANGVGQAISGLMLALLLRSTLSASAPIEEKWIGGAGIMVLGMMLFGLRVEEARDAERLGQNYVMRVRLRIFDRLADLPARNPAAGRLGVTMSRLISDLNSMRNWVSLGIARTIVASISGLGLTGGLIWMTPRAGLGVAVMLLACLLFAALLTPRLRAEIRESRRRRGRLANNLGEKILALPTVRLLGRRAPEKKRIRLHSLRLSDSLVRRAALGTALRSLPDIAMPITVALIALSAAAGASHPNESVVAILILGLVTTCLRDLARAWDYRLAFDEGNRRIRDLLRGARVEESKNADELPSGGPLSVDVRRVSVEGVFDDLSLRIEASEHVVLLGPSGAGKSTLIALMARMFDPDAGEIRMGPVPIRSLRLDSLYGAVQRVSADMPLLRGTVAENIGYGPFEADSERIDQVVAACGLALASPQLPNGLETRVEEQGQNLSEGVRARISLARAAALEPRLLLVDDATFVTDRAAAAALRSVRALSPVTCIVVGIDDQRDLETYDRILTFSGSRRLIETTSKPRSSMAQQACNDAVA